MILTFPILYINSLHLSLTGPGIQADWARGGGWGGLLQIGPGVQADRARRGGWGRERFVTDRPGPALPDFDLTKTRSRLPAQTSIASSCIGNYIFYNAGFPICFSGALIPFYVCVFVAAKKSANV